MIKLAKHRYPLSLIVAYFERTNSLQYGQTSKEKVGWGLAFWFFMLLMWAFLFLRWA